MRLAWLHLKRMDADFYAEFEKKKFGETMQPTKRRRGAASEARVEYLQVTMNLWRI